MVYLKCRPCLPVKHLPQLNPGAQNLSVIAVDRLDYTDENRFTVPTTHKRSSASYVQPLCQPLVMNCNYIHTDYQVKRKRNNV